MKGALAAGMFCEFAFFMVREMASNKVMARARYAACKGRLNPIWSKLF